MTDQNLAICCVSGFGRFANAMYRFFTFQERSSSSLSDFLAHAWSALEGQGVEENVLRMFFFVSRQQWISEAFSVGRVVFGHLTPPITAVAQPPCSGHNVTLLVWTIEPMKGVIVRRPRPNVAVLSQGGNRWVHVGATEKGSPANGLEQDTSECWRALAEGLEAGGLDLNCLVRTWLYIPEITTIEEGIERYQWVNRIRGVVFSNCTFGRFCLEGSSIKTCYPASTGIGTFGTRFVLEGIGWKPENDRLGILPLENPRQTSPIEYGNKYGKCPPMFSRAIGVVSKKDVMVFVSGTASVTNSETVHSDSAEKQTIETLRNIDTLIGARNFRENGLSIRDGGICSLAYVLVYVKTPHDFETVRDICEKTLPALPIVYVHADLCRENLLVEIEGVAFIEHSR